MVKIKMKCWVILFKLILILLLPNLFSSCEKHKNPVPVARFSVTIDLDHPDYIKESFVLNYDPYTRRVVGVSGVIVVRKVTGDGYNVFERYCPYDQKTSCKVNLDKDFPSATCPCCESRFFIGTSEGDVLDGPSVYPLKTYKTRLDGHRLTIYN